MSTDANQSWASAFVHMVAANGGDQSAYSALHELAVEIEQDKELRNSIVDNSIPIAERVAVVTEVVKDQNLAITALLVALIASDDIRDLEDIAEKSLEHSVHSEGAVYAKVRSALELNDEAKQRLVEQLENETGRPVELIVEVDEELLGGLVVDVDGRLYDASVASQLESLRHAIADAA